MSSSLFHPIRTSRTSAVAKGFGTEYSLSIPKAGLIGLWKASTGLQDTIGESVIDRSGNGYNIAVKCYVPTWDTNIVANGGDLLNLDGNVLRFVGSFKYNSAPLNYRAIFSRKTSFAAAAVGYVLYVDSSGRAVAMCADGTSIYYTTPITLAIGTVYDFDVSFDNIAGSISLTINSSTEVASTSGNLGFSNSEDFIVGNIGDADRGYDFDISTLSAYVNDVLHEKWVFESGSNFRQTTVYGLNGNDLELSGGSVPYFSTPFSGSYLAVNGGKFVENGIEYSGDFTNARWNTFGSPVITDYGEYQRYTTTEDTTIFMLQQNITQYVTGDTVTCVAWIRNGESERSTPLVSTELDATGISSTAFDDLLSTSDFIPVTLKSTLPSDGIEFYLASSGADPRTIDVKNFQLFRSTTPALYSNGDSIAHSAVLTGGYSYSGIYTAIFSATNRIEYVENAVGGSILTEIYSRMSTDLASTSYPLIFVEGGYNDLVVSDISVMTGAIDNIITLAKSKASKVVVFGIPLSSVTSETSRAKAIAYNTYVSGVCAADSKLKYFDPTYILGDGTTVNSSMYEVDTIHPNLDGHRAIANALISQVTIPPEAEQYPEYIETSGTYIEKSIIPSPISGKTFNGVFDAPRNVFTLNFPEEPELITADDTELLFTGGSANDVDPADIPANTGDNIFKGPRAWEVYSIDQDAARIAKIDRYNGN